MQMYFKFKMIQLDNMNVSDLLTFLSTIEQPRTHTQTGGTNSINASGGSTVRGNTMRAGKQPKRRRSKYRFSWNG